jgi:gas vesicle protein
MSTRAEDLRAEAERQRQAIATDLEMVGDRVSPGRMAERRKAAVRGRFTDVRTRVMGAVPSSDPGDGPGLTDRASSAASTLGQTPQKATQATQGNPLGAGLVAFGAGLLAATLLPESDKERQLAQRVQPRVDELASEVGGAARHVADEVKPVAQDAGQAVAESAKGSATTVRDQAQGAAQDVKGTAQDQAKTVKDEAQNQARTATQDTRP